MIPCEQPYCELEMDHAGECKLEPRTSEGWEARAFAAETLLSIVQEQNCKLRERLKQLTVDDSSSNPEPTGTDNCPVCAYNRPHSTESLRAEIREAKRLQNAADTGSDADSYAEEVYFLERKLLRHDSNYVTREMCGWCSPNHTPLRCDDCK